MYLCMFVESGLRDRLADQLGHHLTIENCCAIFSAAGSFMTYARVLFSLANVLFLFLIPYIRITLRAAQH